jgi:site-specific DNA recombinase
MTVGSDLGPENPAGVQRQEQDCRALGAQKGWHLAGVYCDNDVSAYSGRRRPEYRRLLTDIKAGRIDGVGVWHLDPLHRSPRELEDFFAIVDEAGVTHVATVTGDHNLGTNEGRLQARLLGSVARFESDHKRDRIKREPFGNRRLPAE